MYRRLRRRYKAATGRLPLPGDAAFYNNASYAPHLCCKPINVHTVLTKILYKTYSKTIMCVKQESNRSAATH